MVRGLLGFVIAAAAWLAAFFVMTFGVAFVWPGYAAHGSTWFESGVFTFEPPMAVVNVVCWALAEVLAGWLAVAIARRREPMWALAAVLAGYMSVLHLFLEWPRFPWWYNLAVALPAAPAVLLGGRLAGRFLRSSSPAMAH